MYDIVVCFLSFQKVEILGLNLSLSLFNLKLYFYFFFQEFHVAYVFIKMANSPRPAIWALERSTDNGKTYKPWQYFADSPR